MEGKSHKRVTDKKNIDVINEHPIRDEIIPSRKLFEENIFLKTSDRIPKTNRWIGISFPWQTRIPSAKAGSSLSFLSSSSKGLENPFPVRKFPATIESCSTEIKKKILFNKPMIPYFLASQFNSTFNGQCETL